MRFAVHRWCPILCLAVVLTAAGCATGPAAAVGETAITRESLAKELAAIAGNRAYVRNYEEQAKVKAVDGGRRPSKLFRAVTLTNDITFVAVRYLAEQRGVRASEPDAEAKKAAAAVVGGAQFFEGFPPWYQRDLEHRTMVSMALRRALLNQTTPEQYYRRNRDQFVRACTSDILVKTMAEAEAVRKRILAGESFTDVAREVSIDRGTGPRGGFLSCNERGDLVLELDAAAFSLPMGELSQPIEIENGFHILKVDSRATPPLDKIRGEIDEAMAKSAAQELKSLIRLRLRQLGVKVARDYGRWDAARIVVVPPR